MKKNRAVFLDRDGVVNYLVYRNGKLVSPRKAKDFKLKRGIISFLKKIKRLGFLIIIITNQPDISRRLMSREELDKMHSLLLKKLAVDRIFVCPHDDKDKCSCRKPKPGMIKKALGEMNIDPSESFMIGDTWRDIGAGKSANLKTILLDAPYNKDVQSDLKVKNLKEIFEIIKNS